MGSDPTWEDGEMIAFMLGAATGYVLGARAGRERYEQLASAYRRIADHPAVQGAAGIAKAKVVDAVHGAAGTRRDPRAGSNNTPS
jgi:hypothetical protein